MKKGLSPIEILIIVMLAGAIAFAVFYWYSTKTAHAPSNQSPAQTAER